MGIARIMKHENSNDTSGTPGYMGKIKYYPIDSSGSNVPIKS